MEFVYIVLIIIVIMTLIASSRSSIIISNRFDIDTKIIFLETNKKRFTNEQLSEYIVLLKNYRDKQSSSKLTALFYIARNKAKKDLEKACEDLSKFYKTVHEYLDDEDWSNKISSM